MFLNEKITELFEKFSNDENLSDIKFIRAYPYAKKATILESVVATLSPGDISVESVAMDNKSYYGSFGVNIDVFVPYEKGSPASMDVTERIINSALDMTSIGVKVGKIHNDTITACYRVSATVTYNGAISKEEAYGE